jgi:hypothetical protein
LWPELLSAIGGVTALTAALVFLVRLILSHWLAKDLEYLKSELSTDMKGREIRFSALQARRADILARLYGSLSDAYVHGRALASAVQRFGLCNQEQRAEATRKASNRALRIAYRSKIWLPHHLPENVAKLASALGETALTFYFYAKSPTDELEKRVQEAAGRWIENESEFKETLLEIEIEFRKIVDPETPNELPNPAMYRIGAGGARFGRDRKR